MGIIAGDAYIADVVNEVADKLSALETLALQLKDTALSSLDDLKTAAQNFVSGLNDIDYSADTSGIPMTYTSIDTTLPNIPDFSSLAPSMDALPSEPTLQSAPTLTTAPTVPAAITVPDPDAPLIDQDTIDDIFNQAADDLAEQAVANTHDAQYEASAMGIGLNSSALALRLQRANEDADDKISKAALQKAISTGQWKREDIKTLIGYQIQNYPLKPELDIKLYLGVNQMAIDAFKSINETEVATYVGMIDATVKKYTAEVAWVTAYLEAENARYKVYATQIEANVQAEAERRGWSELQLKSVLEQADKATGYAIAKAEETLKAIQEAQLEISKAIVGLIQAVFAASSYSLHGQGSVSANTNDNFNMNNNDYGGTGA